MERLWSFLRGFSSITKEMAPENRIDLLSEAMEYYSSKVINKMDDTLFRHLKKAAMAERVGLDMLETTYTGTLTEENLRREYLFKNKSSSSSSKQGRLCKSLIHTSATWTNYSTVSKRWPLLKMKCQKNCVPRDKFSPMIFWNTTFSISLIWRRIYLLHGGIIHSYDDSQSYAAWTITWIHEGM